MDATENSATYVARSGRLVLAFYSNVHRLLLRRMEIELHTVVKIDVSHVRPFGNAPSPPPEVKSHTVTIYTNDHVQTSWLALSLEVKSHRTTVETYTTFRMTPPGYKFLECSTSTTYRFYRSPRR